MGQTPWRPSNNCGLTTYNLQLKTKRSVKNKSYKIDYSGIKCVIKYIKITLMEDIYTLADPIIKARIGKRLKAIRLRQNITQKDLAEDADVSLSIVKNIEKGEIKSFDSLVRVMRILGELDAFQPMIEEPTLSPNEYYEVVNKIKKHTRKRAVSRVRNNKLAKESEW